MPPSGREEPITFQSLSAGLGDQCIFETGENLNAAFQNPFWFWRVDENWNANCDLDAANLQGVAVTVYELYYRDDDGGRKTVAKYTVDNDADYLSTDLQWVAPGATGPDADEVMPLRIIDTSNGSGTIVAQTACMHRDIVAVAIAGHPPGPVAPTK